MEADTTGNEMTFLHLKEGSASQGSHEPARRSNYPVL